MVWVHQQPCTWQGQELVSNSETFVTLGGKIGIVDFDSVELGNLHRQIIHTEESVKKGLPKAESARDSVLR